MPDQVLVRDVEDTGRVGPQVQGGVFVFAVVALGTVAIEDRLDVGLVVEASLPGFFARLGPRLRWRPLHGERDRRRKRRGGRVVRRFVTADTRSEFAGTVVDVGPLALQFAIVLIEHLEEDVAVGRHVEVGRAVLLDRDDAPLCLQPEMGGPDGRVLLVEVIDSVIPMAPRGPGTRHLFVDADILCLAALDAFEPMINVGHNANGQRISGKF